MTTKPLGNNVQLPAVQAVPDISSIIARSAELTTRTADLLDISKLAEPCCMCAGWGRCHATLLMAMSFENTGPLQMHSRSLSMGEHLFDEGDEAQSVYVVKAGSVKASLMSAEGNEQVVSFYLPGELLGLDALLGTRLHGSFVMALEDTVVCALPIAHVEMFVNHTQRGLRWLLRLAGREIVRYQHTQMMLNRMKAESRLSYFLLDLSRRFSERGYSAREFNLSMSRRDIGNHLGLSFETVSRLMTRFQKDSLLKVNHHRGITILDAARLAIR